MKYILSFILFLACFTAKAEDFEYTFLNENVKLGNTDSNGLADNGRIGLSQSALASSGANLIMTEKDSIEKKMVGTWTMERTDKYKDHEYWVIKIYASGGMSLNITKEFKSPVKGPNWSYDRKWWKIDFTATYVDDRWARIGVKRELGEWLINTNLDDRGLKVTSFTITEPDMKSLNTNTSDRVKACAKTHAWTRGHIPEIVLQNTRLISITDSQITVENHLGDRFILTKKEK